MKKIYLKLLATCVLTLFAIQSKSQCVFSSSYGNAVVNSAVPGSSVTITTCNWAGEYATVTFSTTGAFTFSSSVATDYITVTDNSNNVLSFGTTPLAVTIPSTGVYYMHISASSPTACSTQNSCRATSVIVPLLPCTGMPNAGTVPASYSICPNTTTSITAIGATAATGIMYQWQQSPNGTTWTNVSLGSGFNTPSLNTTSLTSLTYYRMVISCTTSALSATTSVVSVNPNNPFALCYCNTNLGGSNCFNDNISNVTIIGTALNNTSACNSNTLNGTYTSFPSSAGTTGTLTAGSIYSISVNTTASNIESLWIDFNQNGQFDATEHTQITISSTASVATIATFTVPLSSSLGLTGMRIRTRAAMNVNGPTDAGTYFGSGETEDYVVTIVAASGCSGTPVAGNAISSNSIVCSGSTFTLNLNGATVASGLTYQWQSSPNNTTWTSIPAANAISITQTLTSAAYYRCIVACGSNTASSTSVLVNLMPAPFAGTISGPSNVVANTNNSFTVAPAVGNMQWYSSNNSTGPWSLISGASASVTTINNTPSGVKYYSVVASFPGCLSDTANIAYSVTITPMAGDMVCSAITLPIGPSTQYYTLYGCTTQPGEMAPPNGGCSLPGNWCVSTLENTRWFKFTAPASGYVTIQSPDMDSQMALWRASSCGNLLSASTASLINANDDDTDYSTNGGLMFSSFIRAGCLTPGATYYIQLDTYSMAWPSDSTRVLVTDMGAPLNAGFTGLSSTYCQSSNSYSLIPSTNGGVFTQNPGSFVVTSFVPSIVGTYTIDYSIFGCNTSSTTIVSVCTGIETFEQNDLMVYPNPATNVINISSSANSQNLSLEIYDALGKLILTEKLSAGLNVISISGLESGIYFYKLKEDTELVKNGKLVKE